MDVRQPGKEAHVPDSDTPNIEQSNEPEPPASAVPEVSPGDTVRVRLRDDPDQTWSAPMTVRPPDDCHDPDTGEGSHCTTICAWCLEHWGWDHDIEVVTPAAQSSS